MFFNILPRRFLDLCLGCPAVCQYPGANLRICKLRCQTHATLHKEPTTVGRPAMNIRQSSGGRNCKTSMIS